MDFITIIIIVLRNLKTIKIIGATTFFLNIFILSLYKPTRLVLVLIYQNVLNILPIDNSLL